MALLKKYQLFAAIVAADLILSLLRPAMGWAAAVNSARFVGDILEIVPMVMILMGLFDAWVPRKLVEENIGPRSGLRGMLLAIVLGTAAAGPIYAAFPVALSLRQKGARLANIGIFLGTWAAIKIPMILLESNFIGMKFALVRLILTIPGVIGVGLLMERFIPESAIPEVKAARAVNSTGT
ncbi:MAG TPA: permease [Symbiobacteriaceae bacterium]|jgi:uncharacterized membrane protein YraQ (UPF0718 family)